MTFFKQLKMVVILPIFISIGLKAETLLLSEKVVRETRGTVHFGSPRRHSGAINHLFLYYHPDRDRVDFVLRHRGHEQIESFDLSSLQDVERLKRVIKANQLLDDQELENLLGGVDHQLPHCVDVDPRLHLGNITDIAPFLMSNYLDYALAENLLIQGEQESLLSLQLLDQNFKVKFDFDEKGEIQSLSFLDPTLAQKYNLVVVKKTDAKGMNYYAIQVDDPLFKGDPTLVLLGKNEGNLEILLRRRGSDRFDPADFEQNMYALQFDRGKLVQTGRRLRLNGERHNPYAIKVEDGKGMFWLGVGFSFIGDKEGKVADSVENIVTEELSKTSFRDALSADEIKLLSENVASQVRAQTGGFNEEMHSVVARTTAQGMEDFARRILEKKLEQMLGDDKADMSEIISFAEKNFIQCLSQTVDKKNSEAAALCLDAFKGQAPVDVGRAIIHVKLKEADFSQHTEIADREYRKCLQLSYDPLLAKGKEADFEDKGIDTVKACLYQGLLLALNQGIAFEIDKKIGKAEEAMDIEGLRLTKKETREVVKSFNQCFISNNFYQEGFLNRAVFNIDDLRSVEPKDFEEVLFSCVKSLTVNAGKIAVEKATSHTIEAINKEKKLGLDVGPIVRTAIAKGYSESCLSMQIKETEFNPVLCKHPVTIVAVKEIVKIKAMEMMTPQQQKVLGPRAPFDQCFGRVLKESEGLFQQFVEETRALDKDKVAKTAKELAVENEVSQKSNDCLKESIAWASEHVASELLASKLAENPELALVNIGSKEKKLFGQKIRTCFQQHLAPLRDQDKILSISEELKNICAIQVIANDSEVQGFLIHPLIDQALKLNNLAPEKRREHIPTITKFLSDEMKKAQTIEEAIEKAQGKAFLDRATLHVIENEFLNKEQRDRIQGELKGIPTRVRESVKLNLATREVAKERVRKALDKFLGIVGDETVVERVRLEKKRSLFLKNSDGELDGCVSKLNEDLVSRKVRPYESPIDLCVDQLEISAYRNILRDKVDEISRTLTQEPEVLKRLDKSLVTRFDSCQEKLGSKDVSTGELEACLMFSLDDYTQEFISSIRHEFQDVLGLSVQTEGEFYACMKKKRPGALERLQVQSLHFDQSRIDETSTYQFYQSLISESERLEKLNPTESFSSVGAAWYLESMESCVAESLVPQIIAGLKLRQAELSQFNDEQKEVFNHLADQAEELFSLDGKFVKFDTGLPDDPSNGPKPIKGVVKNIVSDINEFLILATNYNPSGLKESITVMANQMKGRLKVDNYSYKIDEQLDILLQSDVLDRMVQAKVATVVKEILRGQLGPDGINLPRESLPSLLDELTSPKLMARILSDPKLEKAIKEDYVAKLLKGEKILDDQGAEIPEGEIPPGLVEAVKQKLASDQGTVESFADILLGHILKDQGRKITTGEGLKGYEKAYLGLYLDLRQEEFFNWHRMKRTPEGQELMTYFSQHFIADGFRSEKDTSSRPTGLSRLKFWKNKRELSSQEQRENYEKKRMDEMTKKVLKAAKATREQMLEKE